MAQGQKPFYMVLGAVVLVGAIWIATRISGGNPISIPANVIVTAADTSGFRGYVIGAASAPLEVTEYGDFECPQCGSFDQVQWPDIKTRLVDAGKARFRFRDYPLGIHRYSRLAAHAAACGDEQGKFWEVKEGIFGRQTEWSASSDPLPIYRDIVKTAGLDAGKWTDCMKSAKYAGRIQASFNEAEQVGANSTPTFLIAGHLWQVNSADQIVQIVDSIIGATPRDTSAVKPVSGQ